MIQVDQAKVSAVMSWPGPEIQKRLQPLQLCHHLSPFCQELQLSPPPPTAQTSTKVTFQWTFQAFHVLKLKFNSTSRSWVSLHGRSGYFRCMGGVCPFLPLQDEPQIPVPSSCSLSSARRHYDIYNRELWVVQMALEEWCHWLEGAKEPFCPLDWPWESGKHSFCQETELLQSPIFTRFNFILSYHPGSCSIKADVLFQQLQNWEDPVPCAAFILHFPCVVAKLIWEAEVCVKAAMGAHQWAPVVAPTDICLMSVWLRSEVQKWTHSSNLICPPGVQWTWCVLALEVRIVFWMYSGFM